MMFLKVIIPRNMILEKYMIPRLNLKKKMTTCCCIVVLIIVYIEILKKFITN